MAFKVVFALDDFSIQAAYLLIQVIIHVVDTKSLAALKCLVGLLPSKGKFRVCTNVGLRHIFAFNSLSGQKYGACYLCI